MASFRATAIRAFGKPDFSANDRPHVLIVHSALVWRLRRLRAESAK
jgi:hypothetical protein